MAVQKRKRKDGSVAYLAVYFGPDGHRYAEKVRAVPADGTKKDHDRAEAKARARAMELRIKVENGEWSKPVAGALPKRITFRRMVERFLKEYPTRSGSTDYYHRQSAKLVAYFGDRPALAITEADVERYKNARLDEVSPATVRKEVCIISTVFRWAKKRGLVERNPADADLVRRPKEPKHRLDYRTPDDESRLLAVCPPYLARPVQWAIYSGMDRGEIAALRWADVDEHGGRVYAPRAKTGAERIVRLNPTLRAALAGCKEGRQVREIDGSDPVFLNREGEAWTVNALNLALRRAYRRAGLDDRRPWKSLRHTFGTRLAMLGAREFEVKELLGHETTEMARRYVHIADEQLQSLVDRLSPAQTSEPEPATPAATRIVGAD